MNASISIDTSEVDALFKKLDRQFSKDIAKNYLGSIISQPTSQGDRIELLYANLRKQGLI